MIFFYRNLFKLFLYNEIMEFKLIKKINNKIYKVIRNNNINMSPSDPKGSLDAFILIYLNKQYFEESRYGV